jgi:Fic family protein
MRSGTRIRDMLDRIQGEFLELPELRLTSEQAQRLWQLDRSTCDALLHALVDVRFLSRASDGSFVRSSRD